MLELPGRALKKKSTELTIHGEAIFLWEFKVSSLDLFVEIHCCPLLFIGT